MYGVLFCFYVLFVYFSSTLKCCLRLNSQFRTARSEMSKKNRKRKNEDEYNLQTILEDDGSNDSETAEPKAAARNVEKQDEQVRFHNFQTFNVFTEISI